MELIPQSHIREASDSNYDEFYLETSISDRDAMRGMYEDGASFAEQKITPIILEFAEWAHDNFTHYNIGNNNLWLCNDGDRKYTTIELLDKFIKL